jgi:hypothetical protein
VSAGRVHLSYFLKCPLLLLLLQQAPGGTKIPISLAYRKDLANVAKNNQRCCCYCCFTGS